MTHPAGTLDVPGSKVPSLPIYSLAAQEQFETPVVHWAFSRRAGQDKTPEKKININNRSICLNTLQIGAEFFISAIISLKVKILNCFIELNSTFSSYYDKVL
jgi:hypothetical protein